MVWERDTVKRQAQRALDRAASRQARRQRVPASAEPEFPSTHISSSAAYPEAGSSRTDRDDLFNPSGSTSSSRATSAPPESSSSSLQRKREREYFQEPRVTHASPPSKRQAYSSKRSALPLSTESSASTIVPSRTDIASPIQKQVIPGYSYLFSSSASDASSSGYSVAASWTPNTQHGARGSASTGQAYRDYPGVAMSLEGAQQSYSTFQERPRHTSPGHYVLTSSSNIGSKSDSKGKGKARDVSPDRQSCTCSSSIKSRPPVDTKGNSKARQPESRPPLERGAFLLDDEAEESEDGGGSAAGALTEDDDEEDDESDDEDLEGLVDYSHFSDDSFLHSRFSNHLAELDEDPRIESERIDKATRRRVKRGGYASSEDEEEGALLDFIDDRSDLMEEDVSDSPELSPLHGMSRQTFRNVGPSTGGRSSTPAASASSSKPKRFVVPDTDDEGEIDSERSEKKERREDEEDEERDGDRHEDDENAGTSKAPIPKHRKRDAARKRKAQERIKVVEKVRRVVAYGKKRSLVVRWLTVPTDMAGLSSKQLLECITEGTGHSVSEYKVMDKVHSGIKQLHDVHLCTWFQLTRRAEDTDPAALEIRRAISDLYEDLKPILTRLAAETGVRFQRSRLGYVICENSMRNARNLWARHNPDKAEKSKKDGKAMLRASARYEVWSSDDQDGESEEEEIDVKEKRIYRGEKATRKLRAKQEKEEEEARLAAQKGKGKQRRDEDDEDEEYSSPA